MPRLIDESNVLPSVGKIVLQRAIVSSNSHAQLSAPLVTLHAADILIVLID